MVGKSKTKEQIRNWFSEQWTLIEQIFPDQYRSGQLNRLHKMFKGLAGEECL